MRLLIVEDNPAMRRLIRSIVQDPTDEVAECDDGIAGVAAYADFRPDWVLMDIKLPRMDGLTATREIITAFPEAKICIVTEYRDKSTRNAASSAGASAYITKEALHTLRSALGRT